MNASKGEEAIFTEALRLPPEERAAYLAQATEGNDELRRRVESLLDSYEVGDFLERAAAPQLRPTLQSTVPLSEKPGDRIGRYKLLQRIGEGGCGVVYMAEQSEPLRRRVALKIIKLGMDTKSVIARFEAERQALALMDHPNIAKVLDAGATETGRPYFVMELVRGMKITEYCDKKKLSPRARLGLFIQVCQAIQHAHQKGIIHRDIKPSNILVTVNDGVAVPKIIDFGIAKATSGQQLTDKTLFTAFEQFIGTPAYMSPEQAGLTSLDIDTRSDIYALGVLLFELLTGKTPFDQEELLSIGLDEIRRTIREAEPPRPSTRVSALPGQELSTTAQRRGLDAPKLVNELRGDLDWIVMKCLEKDRARRYETANGLANDIQRHLNNEPVVASPPSRLYRLGKLMRRNKLAFAAAGALAASLVIGSTISTAFFFRERAARRRSDQHAAFAKAVSDSLQRALRWHAESCIRPDPESWSASVLTLHETFERMVKEYGDLFTDQPMREAAAQRSIGLALLGLGEAEESTAYLQRALEVSRKELGLDHPRTLDSMADLATCWCLMGELDQALLLFQKTLKRQKAVLGPDHPRTLETMDIVAKLLPQLGKYEEAAGHYDDLIQSFPANHRLYMRLAPLLVANGNLADYRGLCQIIVARFRDATDPTVASRMARTCLLLPDSGADLDAVAKMADTGATSTNRWTVPWCQLTKCLAEYRKGRFASAVVWANKTLTAAGSRVERDCQAYMVLAMSLYRLRQIDEAREVLARGTEIAQTKFPELEGGRGNWGSQICALTLMDEATALIEGSPEAGSPAK